jgi:DNA recombination protein RmuC
LPRENAFAPFPLYESRVLVSARRLRDLKAAPEGVEIEPIEPVERTARALQAPELLPPGEQS